MLVTVDGYCELVYGRRAMEDKRSRKNKRDTVTRMCRKGSLECKKVGRKWLINI